MIKILDIYKQFRCIAGKCPDSCCTGWKIIVDNESADKYNQAVGNIGDRLRRALVDGNKKYFRLDGDRCPFLNKDNLCDIYIELGESSLCETCTAYPRVIRKEQKNGNMLMEACLTMSCPEAARLMMEKRIEIEELTDTNDNAVDNRQSKSIICSDDMVQNLCISIIQDRRVPLYKRIITVIMFINVISREKNVEIFEDIYTQFEDMKMRKEFMDGITQEDKKDVPFIIYELMKKYFEICDTRIHNNETIKYVENHIGTKEQFASEYEYMCKKYDEYVEQTDKEYCYENLLIYYIFRHYKELSRKKLINEYITMMCVCYVITKTMHMLIYKEEIEIKDAESVEIFQYYSKITEHSVKDYNKLLSFMQSRDYIRIIVLIRMVC